MRNLLLLFSAVVVQDAVMALPRSSSTAVASSKTAKTDRVIILDVDNTLYSERNARNRGVGIEEQIIQNTHQFCENMNVSREEADSMFREYGSTIEGLRQTMKGQLNDGDGIDNLMERYYKQVWSKDFDYTSILKSASNNKDLTGYSHASSSLQQLLENCPHPIYFASNSPSWHVANVKKALGLCKIPGTIVSPDTIQDEELTFPTKANPEIYFKSIQRENPDKRLILIDDSKLNIEKACWKGVEGIHVVDGNVEEAFGAAIGNIDRDYVFSDVNYLKAKNVVDAKSIDASTWERFAKELDFGEDGVLRITDLGAGILMMLQSIMRGVEDKRSLLELRDDIKQIEYHAYESNLGLFEGCLETMASLGFLKTPRNEPKEGDTYLFVNKEQDIKVYVHWYDYEAEKENQRNAPHAILGSCFADLMEPNHLVQSLERFLRKAKNSVPTKTLAYFPITFAGQTQLLPAQPFCKSGCGGWIPSDTSAFRMYSKALCEDHGHNLDPQALVYAFEHHGGEMVTAGSSDWVIDKAENPYFWETMMYFFGIVGAPKLLIEGWDSVAWIERSKTKAERIRVSNVDLLFRLEASAPPTNTGEPDDSQVDMEEIQFTAPYLVETKKRGIDVTEDLKDDQVLIESVCSLISSGTELKIYRGNFDDAALDTNIEGMANERMEYPLSYGYSLVGRITHVGSSVSEDLVGKLAFTFSPHASHVITSQSAIQLIPDGISAEDAMFMPSVETALSLVHDAHIRVGEQVAVYGQGLIGLLVTSLLAMQKTPLDAQTGAFGTITAFDTIPERLAMASVMGASQALEPSQVGGAGPFDISIEISGNARALQSAIDNTRNGGRVVVGSWYGNNDVALKLGIDFHRSHKTIKTSQVSDIPAELRTLWSKERRFALTWELVKLLKPSRLLTKTTSLVSAGEAYESLDQGKEIAVAFSYCM